MDKWRPLPNPAAIRPTGGLISLLFVYCAALCISLVQTADAFPDVVVFRASDVLAATLGAASFGLISALFALTRFSFGYFVGFYFFSIIFGYVWLVKFSVLSYNHSSAVVSIIVSCLTFLAPALLITSPMRRSVEWPKQRFDVLPSLILLLAIAILTAGAMFSFRPVGLSEMYQAREQLQLPAWLRYAIGITTNVLLPFAFASFTERKKYARAAIVLLVLVLFYPVTLTKLTLFAAPWLLFLVVLSRIATPRTSIILSLLVPLSVGITLSALMKSGFIGPELASTYVGTVNSRMIALPSIALDVYNDYFARSPLTYFCQINALKFIISCPYSEPLSIVMSKTYHLGNLNASLFATEGIASLGLLLAPLSALGCGLVIALANRVSSELPAPFIIVSGGMLPHVMLNVPLSTSLLTYGGAVLFLLWYITPRSAFGRECDNRPADLPGGGRATG